MNGCNENAIEFMTNGTKATLTFSQGRYKSVICQMWRHQRFYQKICSKMFP